MADEQPTTGRADVQRIRPEDAEMIGPHEQIRRSVGKVVPYYKLAELEPQTVSEGFGVVTLPKRAEVMGNLGAVHPSALYTLAQAAGDCAVSGGFAKMLPFIKPRLHGAQVQYEDMRVKGEVKATAKIEGDLEHYRQEVMGQRSVVFPVVVTLETADGVAGKITFEWEVGRAR